MAKNYTGIIRNLKHGNTTVEQPVTNEIELRKWVHEGVVVWQNCFGGYMLTIGGRTYDDARMITVTKRARKQNPYLNSIYYDGHNNYGGKPINGSYPIAATIKASEEHIYMVGTYDRGASYTPRTDVIISEWDPSTSYASWKDYKKELPGVIDTGTLVGVQITDKSVVYCVCLQGQFTKSFRFYDWKGTQPFLTFNINTSIGYACPIPRDSRTNIDYSLNGGQWSGYDFAHGSPCPYGFVTREFAIEEGVYARHNICFYKYTYTDNKVTGTQKIYIVDCSQISKLYMPTSVAGNSTGVRMSVEYRRNGEYNYVAVYYENYMFTYSDIHYSVKCKAEYCIETGATTIELYDSTNIVPLTGYNRNIYDVFTWKQYMEYMMITIHDTEAFIRWREQFLATYTSAQTLTENDVLTRETFLLPVYNKYGLTLDADVQGLSERKNQARGYNAKMYGTTIDGTYDVYQGSDSSDPEFVDSGTDLTISESYTDIYGAPYACSINNNVGTDEAFVDEDREILSPLTPSSYPMRMYPINSNLVIKARPTISGMPSFLKDGIEIDLYTASGQKVTKIY